MSTHTPGPVPPPPFVVDTAEGERRLCSPALLLITIVQYLTLGAHAQRGLRYLVCLSLLQLASITFIRPKNDTTYLAGHVDGHVRTNLSENYPLQSYSVSIIVQLCSEARHGLQSVVLCSYTGPCMLSVSCDHCVRGR